MSENKGKKSDPLPVVVSTILVLAFTEAHVASSRSAEVNPVKNLARSLFSSLTSKSLDFR